MVENDLLGGLSPGSLAPPTLSRLTHPYSDQPHYLGWCQTKLLPDSLGHVLVLVKEANLSRSHQNNQSMHHREVIVTGREQSKAKDC